MNGDEPGSGGPSERLYAGPPRRPGRFALVLTAPDAAGAHGPQHWAVGTAMCSVFVVVSMNNSFVEGKELHVDPVRRALVVGRRWPKSGSQGQVRVEAACRIKSGLRPDNAVSRGSSENRPALPMPISSRIVPGNRTHADAHCPVDRVRVSAMRSIKACNTCVAATAIKGPVAWSQCPPKPREPSTSPGKGERCLGWAGGDRCPGWPGVVRCPGWPGGDR